MAFRQVEMHKQMEIAISSFYLLASKPSGRWKDQMSLSICYNFVLMPKKDTYPADKFRKYSIPSVEF